MYEILAITVGNLRRILRQPIMIFTVIALPFAIITVIGIVLGGNANGLSIGIYSPGTDAVSTQLVTALETSGGLTATSFGDEASLVRAVRLEQVSAGVIVPPGYGTAAVAGRGAVIQFLTTPFRNDTTLRMVVGNIVNAQEAPIQAGVFSASATGRQVAGQIKRAQNAEFAGVQQPRVVTRSVASAAAMRMGVDYSGPSNLTLFVILTSMTATISLIQSRRTGITARMFAMPVRRIKVLLGEFGGRLAIALFQAAIILLFCSLIFGVRWGDPAGVAVLTGTLCVFGAALGLLVGFSAKTIGQAIAFGPPVGVVLGMLGGNMWPLSIVGNVMRMIGHATPNAWAMDGYVTLINTGGGVASVARPVTVIGAMAAAMLAAAAVVVRVRRAQ
jgi:ABC-2 type transport system permease protein